jgi:PPOX class probable F420-dependent enzyme
VLSQGQITFIDAQRVARLATAEGKGAPHIVPVCFVLAQGNVYVALDSKPKRTIALRLKRVLNIKENPRVSLLVDRYDEDWTKLAWVRLDGDAEVLLEGRERQEALGLLRQRYSQYATMLPEDAPVIAVRISRVSSWGDLADST